MYTMSLYHTVVRQRHLATGRCLYVCFSTGHRADVRIWGMRSWRRGAGAGGGGGEPWPWWHSSTPICSSAGRPWRSCHQWSGQGKQVKGKDLEAQGPALDHLLGLDVPTEGLNTPVQWDLVSCCTAAPLPWSGCINWVHTHGSGQLVPQFSSKASRLSPVVTYYSWPFLRKNAKMWLLLAFLNYNPFSWLLKLLYRSNFFQS